MSDELVQIERDGKVALLRLNRPAARNAMNQALATATCEAITSCQDAGAIVITGNGPAFCAGLDLRNLGVENMMELAPFNATASASAVPMIAAVNGPAVTGGFELALACDFIVGSENSAFADTHVRVGVYPGPVMVDLPRRVGMAWAREMSLTGNFVDADTALRIGLMNHLVAADELIPFCMKLAHAIAENDAKMIRAMRKDWDETGNMVLEDARRVHTEHGRSFRGVTGSDIAARREAVIARAHTQLP